MIISITIRGDRCLGEILASWSALAGNARIGARRREGARHTAALRRAWSQRVTPHAHAGVARHSSSKEIPSRRWHWRPIAAMLRQVSRLPRSLAHGLTGNRAYPGVPGRFQAH
jgi:hypothetical protein